MSERRATHDPDRAPLSERSPVKPGQIIGGKYKVERLVGEGGMGIVVAARHAQLGHRVAIKFLSEEAAGDKIVVGRFVHEAQAVAPLRSEHVVRVHDVSSESVALPYMVMEFLEGVDLGQLLDRTGPLPIDDAVDYLLEACEGVAEAHAAGIIHRDLKPSNLFLAQNPDGSAIVKVLDFGISKAQNQAGRPHFTTTTDLIGTPSYMSPEQLRSSKTIDKRADIWALGLILYELVTAHTAFQADTMPQLCSLILADDPPPPTTYRPDLPPELDAIIMRCIRKRPDERFADCGELATALIPFGGEGAAMSAGKVRRVLHSLPEARVDLDASTFPPPPQPGDEAAVESGHRPQTVSAWGSGARKLRTTQRRGIAIVVVSALIGVGAIVIALAVVSSGGSKSPASSSTTSANATATTASTSVVGSATPTASWTAVPTTTPSASATAKTTKPSATVRPTTTASANAATPTAPPQPPPKPNDDSQFGDRK